MRLSRATAFRWHSWLGLATGAFMLVIAWSGSIAVFNDEIGWLLTPELRADPAAGVRPLDDAIASLRARFPERRFDLHVQSGPNWAHTAYVYEPGRTIYVHVDPATAAVTRADVMSGYTWNVVYFIRQLHVRLLMGFWGRVFVGIFGVTLVLSIVTSLYVYRDWLRSLVRIRRDSGRRIFHMDLHKAVGAWALAINLVFGVTGAVLGLENLYNRVLPRRAAERSPAPPGVTLSAGLTHGAAAQALAAFDPAFVPTVLQVNPAQPVAIIRGDHPGALIAKDASVYRIQLATGRVLERSDARAAAWPAYLYNTLDPLHFGYFGDKWSNAASYAIKIVWCVLGLTPGVLGITGGYMWLLRRRRARAAAAARAALLPAAATEPAMPVSRRRGWYVAGWLPFLAAGYALQASTWNRGWGMSEVLWQHWIIKPLCLIIVGFPLTLAAVALGAIALSFATRRRIPAMAMLAAVPVGALYLVATSLFN
jgi:uncharacterized iron-regulated membrane protein